MFIGWGGNPDTTPSSCIQSEDVSRTEAEARHYCLEGIPRWHVPGYSQCQGVQCVSTDLYYYLSDLPAGNLLCVFLIAVVFYFCAYVESRFINSSVLLTVSCRLCSLHCSICAC